MKEAKNLLSGRVNVWQILFLITATVYVLHFYVLSSEHHSDASASHKDSLNKATRSRLRVTVTNSAGLYPNIEGSIAGRPYTILNENIDSAMSATAQQRLDLARSSLPVTRVLSSNGPRKLPQLRYMHIPRTGNALVATAVHYCCNNLGNILIDNKMRYETQPWKLDVSCRVCFRQPITSNGECFSSFPYIHLHDEKKVITMMRNPLERIASQIVEMRSLRGMMVSWGITSNDADVFVHVVTNRFTNTYDDFVHYLQTKASFHALLSSNKATKELSKHYREFLGVVRQCYDGFHLAIPHLDIKQNFSYVENCRYLSAAHFPGIKGCMTRMVLGYNCLDVGYSISPSDMLEAKRRLNESFAFVGMPTILLISLHEVMLILCIYCMSVLYYVCIL
ncbi:hypothetical protein EON65_11090 [archaeon]|nr:MAG: hypothetical protein EON65_11090 [archaeon]